MVPCLCRQRRSGQRIRVYKVVDLVDVRSTQDTLRTRPADFDLEDAWRRWCDHIRQDRGRYLVAAHVSPQMYVDLPLYLGEHLVEEKISFGRNLRRVTAGVEWRPVTLHFDSLERPAPSF